MFFDNLFIKYEVFLMKLVFYYFKLSGLATIDLHIRPQRIFQRKIWNFSASEFYFIPNIVLIILSNIIFFFLATEIYETKYDKYFFVRSVNNFKIILMHSIIFIILVKYCYQRKKVLLISNIMSQLQQSANFFNVPKIANNCNFRDLLLILLFQSLCVIYIILIFMFDSNDDVFQFILMSLFTFVTEKTIIQYIGLLRLMKKLIILINNELHRCTKNVTYFCDLKKTSSNLKQIRKLICLLKKFSREISNFYSLPVICYLSSIIVNSVINFYYNLNVFLSGKPTFLDYVLIFMALMSFILLRKLTRTVSNIINEVNTLLIYQKIFFIQNFYY